MGEKVSSTPEHGGASPEYTPPTDSNTR
uniref:Uncharacterized protein n=1 Tax=Arundo donax TaxID=35708 RepID=A0A0A9GKV3_ARUDO